MNDDIRFRFRAVGVARHEGSVLIHRADVDDFWSLPGGAVESGETAPEALAREMREELNTEVTVGRLLFVLENLFAYAGVRYQEVGFYFDMAFPPDSPLLRKRGTHAGVEAYFNEQPAYHLIFEWIALSDLASRVIKPAPIVPLLNIMDDRVYYVTNNELRVTPS